MDPTHCLRVDLNVFHDDAELPLWYGIAHDIMWLITIRRLNEENVNNCRRHVLKRPRIGSYVEKYSNKAKFKANQEI